MLEKSKYKSFYIAGLVVVVIAIWAYNIIQFVDIAESKEKVVTEISANKTVKTDYEIRDTATYSFKGNYRDPFSYSNLTQMKKNRKQDNPLPPAKKEPEPIRLPDIKLTGVIERTAILKTPDNSTYFLKGGEAVNEIVVKSIWDDSVWVEYKDKSFKLRIAN